MIRVKTTAGSKKLPSWLEKIGVEIDLGLDSWNHITTYTKVSLASYALKSGQIFYEFKKNGCVEEPSFAKLTKVLQKYTTEMILARTNHIFDNFENVKKGDSIFWTFLDEKTVIHMDLNIEDESYLTVFTLDKARGKKIQDDFGSFFEKRSSRPGRVHVLEQTSDGVQINELGKGGVTFLRDNYETSICEDFDFVANQLNKKEPQGRLFILDGPAGSGKTYFVRGLLEAVLDVVFLLVPSNQIAALTDASFMPTIRRFHEQEEVPIIFILEDADNALLPRAEGNMSVISDLLNFSDGIIGSIIDVRIIATTNAKNMEIEKALKRARRMGRAVHIGKLSGEKASQIYERLTGTPREIQNNKFTLAEVYALADGVDEKTFLEQVNDHRSKTGF